MKLLYFRLLTFKAYFGDAETNFSKIKLLFDTRVQKFAWKTIINYVIMIYYLRNQE